MQNPNENWQVEVKGEIYETTFAELTVWIAENSLLPEDRVRRGNLRWLDAGKVPPLRPFFDAKANGTEPPIVQVNVTDAMPEHEEASVAQTQNIPVVPEESPEQSYEDPVVEDEQRVPESGSGIDQSICNVHPELQSFYACEACLHGFCKSCPQSFGSNVKICPYCGGMCKPFKEVNENAADEARIRKDISEGFGFGDFASAFGYPFRFKSSLFGGGLIVAILGYGQSAASMGSFFLIAAAIICFVLSSAIVFGMVSNTLDNFAKGDVESNFLAGLEDFSAWDTIIHPFLLFLGVYISSFGLATALILGMVWYAFNTITSQVNSQATQIAALTKESDQSSAHVEQIRQKFVRQNQGRTDVVVGADGLTDGQRRTIQEEAEFQQVNDIAKNYKKAQLESTIGKTPETQQAEMRAMLTQFAKVAGVFVILIGLAMLWGFFYFPAACAVAGYTKSFGAAINPLVGLDTIKHLGLDYFKILVMTFMLSIVNAVIGGILALVLSPFNLPGLGNLPANFAASFVGFYFWIVFAVMLGYALYKNSDKLKLYR
ncbi:MAG: hypothetical protein HKN33_12140 [Pyrinomonadaceae bacterium]|nr:hypothetical protein [Pyrinomonadaceae bacterium]